MSEGSGPPDRGDRASRGRLAWTLLGVLGFYAAAVLVATYPAVLDGRTALAVADLNDPLQHLWTLRWYRSCLLEGRFPLFTDALQAPVGSPLGLYSPLLLQGALYLGLSTLTTSDTVAYNLILWIQFVFTGFATFLLAWRLLNHRLAAAMAGLLAMLGGPMTFAARTGGTELLSLGGFPLFLVGWMRFVDRPSRGRLASAVALFLLLAAGSPYYAVMSVFPAALYPAVGAWRAGRAGVVGWVRARGAWLAAFGLLAVATSPMVLPAQLWAVAEGYPMGRSRDHFEQFRANIWSYAVAPGEHRWANLVLPPFSQTPWVRDRVPVYLGVVTLALLGYGAVNRVKFRDSGYLWLCLGVLVVLSMGASTTVGSVEVPLPALWLWEHVPPFGALRVPARYGYLGAVCAAVLAGGAMAALDERMRTARRRALVAAALFAVAIADLSTAPYPSRPLPTAPRVYGRLLERTPGASFCEVHPTGRGFDYLRYQSTLAYWQSLHGGRTSAGNPGVENRAFAARAYANSPFHHARLADPEYLSTPGRDAFDLVRDARFEDYAWLYLHAMQYDYLILHKWTWDGTPTPAPLLRIRERLAGAILVEDDAVAVLDPRRLDPPTRPTALCLAGWRERVPRSGATGAIAGPEATALVYNPTPGQPLQLELSASSYLEPRVVRVLAGDDELARWTFRPGPGATGQSRPFYLPEGLHTLRIASDGAASPGPSPARGNTAPISLWVSSVRVTDAPTRVGHADDDTSPRR